MNLENKVAVITGAAQGIGKAVSLTMAKYGANVVVADLQEAGVKEVAKKIEVMGRTGLAVQLDVTDSNQVSKVMEAAIKKFGKIDILVNAAGIAVQSAIDTMSEDLWDKTMNINAKGVFLCCKAAARHMMGNKSGKIVNVSSRAAKIGEAANAAYCSSKAAVGMFTQVLALEMAPYGINVNAVCPALVDTEMIENAIVRFSREKGISPEEFKRSWVEEIPLKRMAKPEEIGEFIAFLCSDKSDYLTGSSYNIDGGAVRI